MPNNYNYGYYDSIYTGQEIDAAIGKAAKLDDSISGASNFIRTFQTSTSDAAGSWTVQIPDIPNLTEGLTIRLMLMTSYKSSYNTLRINGGAEKLVYFRFDTVLTNHYSRYSCLTLTYSNNASTNDRTLNSVNWGKSGWIIENIYNSTNIDASRLTSAQNTDYAIKRYYLLGQTSNSKLIPFTQADNTIAANKTLVSYAFNPIFPILYYSVSNNISAGSSVGTHTLHDRYSGVDLRYTFNTGTTLVAKSPIFLKLQINNDNTVKIPISGTSFSNLVNNPIVQSLPTTEDGYIYKYLGVAYDNYRLNLTENQPCFQYKSGKIIEYTGFNPEYIIKTTWNALKTLRNSHHLIPGQQYRITDYRCTTTQFDTQSAEHQFDIIVIADDVDTLNENARAILHEGDTYFSEAGAKLEAWELKYSIDNDPTRFAWADPDNGKGVIYYMKDEWNNECPYDFKNILFKRYCVEDTTSNGILEYLDGKYLGFIGGMQNLSILDEDDFIWCYTFTADYEGECLDNTLEQAKETDNEFIYHEIQKGCRNNIIETTKVLIQNDEDIFKSILSLNNIVFIRSVEGGVDLNNDMIESHFGINNYDMTFLNGDIIKTETCCYSIVGNIYKSTFGNNCYCNTFGNNCDYNTFGNNCYCNTFGNNCYYNTFGNNCYCNTFGNNCDYNTFGTHVQNNKMTINYCWYNTFEKGVSYVNLTTGNSGNYNNLLQNVHIHEGVCGSSSNYKTITVNRNNNFCTDVRTKNDITIEVD